MTSTNLIGLPAVPLEVITCYLGYTDLVSLATTHPNFRFLMPKEHVIEGQDFGDIENGLNAPETYMDVPILTRSLVQIKMSFRWMNQGYRDGKMWLQLIRAGEVVADCRDRCPTLLSHRGLFKFHNEAVVVANHPVVFKAKKGDILRVMRKIGGGGSQFLSVKDFAMRIAHKNERA